MLLALVGLSAVVLPAPYTLVAAAGRAAGYRPGMSATRRPPRPSLVRTWLDRWSALLPVLVAEFVVLVGFGALLPILPLYLVRNGIDNALLGLIIAAWPLAKLVSEPIFGYLADRRSRRPLMVAALLIMAFSMLLPVWFTTAPAFFVSRLIGGAAAGMYDPAARGIIVDATTEDRRGEAFGLYGSFQMGGLILGPVLGSAGAAALGGFTFPFLLTAGLLVLSTIYLWSALKLLPSAQRRSAGSAATEPPAASASPAQVTRTNVDVPPSHLGPGGEELTIGLVAQAAIDAAAHRGPSLPVGPLLNRLLIAAVVMQFGFSFSTGVYEVVWSLYMENLGASLEWIGLTFTLFAIPVVVVSPLAGRLVDRYGGIRFAVGGGLAVAAAGLAYTLATEPVMPALVGLLEACGFAFLGPALFWLLARGTPAGRTSTAQGIFGAAGTVGFIASALAAGTLWGIDTRFPFYLFVIVVVVSIGAGALIARWSAQPARAIAPPA